MAERLGLTLSKEQVKQAETDAYIVARLKAVLAVLKFCDSEEQRQDLHVVLGAFAPERSAERERSGMIRRVVARLGIQRGSRYIKATKIRRPYPLERAISRRAAFDEAVDSSKGPLQPGSAATSHGQPCTVVEIDYEADTCTLAFSAGSAEQTRSFNCIYKGKDAAGKAPFPKGSARLRCVPPSLRPQLRETRKDEKAEAARPKVEELFNTEGARSPSQRDRVRRRVGVGLYETSQALFVYAKMSALYTMFLARYTIQISFATFKKLRPWYVKRAKEVTCCCKTCDNFKQYQTTLHSLAELFEPLLEPSTIDAQPHPARDDETEVEDEDSSAAATWAGRAALEKLLQFCALQSKSEMVKSVLCAGAFDGAGKEDCINGKCSACGFCKLWSQGLRRHVVDSETGNVLASAPVQYQSEVKWVRIRSSKKTAPGEAKQPSYEPRRGTVVQFLDEFEREAMRKFPHHRFTIHRQKAMDAEFARNRWPGWLQIDVDFAMDGTIPPPQGRSMQADHWVPMSYTLFPAVVSWLESAAWKSRTSSLAVGDAVTVEPASLSQREATEPAAGSFWAEIVLLPAAATEGEPEQRVYGVRRHGAAADAPLELVERQYLRHRKLHTEAFIHVSDDKTHDSHAAQTFINKTLTYLDEHYVKTGKETFVALHMHSDNAPSHFKSSKTMYFLTTLVATLKEWGSTLLGRSFRIVWEFGAPGHGKGVWDGIGAWMKRTGPLPHPLLIPAHELM